MVDSSDNSLETNPYCLICGYDFGEPAYDSYWICPCCKAEAGLDDTSLEEVCAYRQEWLAEGGKWRTESWQQPKEDREPPNWNREEQMKNIPPEWR